MLVAIFKEKRLVRIIQPPKFATIASDIKDWYCENFNLNKSEYTGQWISCVEMSEASYWDYYK